MNLLKDKQSQEEISEGDESYSEEMGGEIHVIYWAKETLNDILQFVSTLIIALIERVIPETPRVLTLEKAAKCLKVLGKIWNLSEYPPLNYVDEMKCGDPEEKLMDMEGYVDEYQYLHIEAVDLALTDIRVIPQNFIWLLSVDLSGNRLNNTSACPITRLPNIVALRLNRNRFDDPYLPPMKHLQYLGLNSNDITSMHRIYHPNLETLDLNYNLISEVDPSDCWKHPKLKQLELRRNALTTTSGIEYASLVTLYLAENQITELGGLEILVNLQRLHLRDNPLSDLTGFTESNVNLKYLNIRKCQVADVTEIQKLSVLKGLKELVLKGNLFNPEPAKPAKEEDVEDEEEEEEEEEEDEDKETAEDEEENEELRIQILSYLPNLVRIDKKLVTKEELQSSKELSAEPD